jgi:hypothetical protein
MLEIILITLIFSSIILLLIDIQSCKVEDHRPDYPPQGHAPEPIGWCSTKDKENNE